MRRSLGPPAARRLAAAEFVSATALWGAVLTLAVHAWHEGGAGAVGLMGLSRAGAAAVCGPLLGGLAHRASRRRVLLVTNMLRTATIAALATLVTLGASLAALLILVAVLGLLGPMFDSVSGALVAEVVEPAGLPAANARVSVARNGGYLVGPVGAGVVVALASTSVALGVLSVVFAASFLPLWCLPDVRPLARRHSPARVGPIVAARDLAGTNGLREAAAFLGLLAMTDGAVDVLAVCAALGYLGAGDAGAGLLQAVIGAGTICGGVLLAWSRRAHRVTTGVVAGSVVLAVSLVTVGFAGGIVAAMPILAIGGLGYSAAEVGSITLVQRRAAADLRAARPRHRRFDEGDLVRRRRRRRGRPRRAPRGAPGVHVDRCGGAVGHRRAGRLAGPRWTIGAIDASSAGRRLSWLRNAVSSTRRMFDGVTRARWLRQVYAGAGVSRGERAVVPMAHIMAVA